MFSKSNTQALKGFAAIGILVFHVLLAYSISPVFNMWGGVFVALFLVLSGYGIEESYRSKGLDGFWENRLRKVVLPTAFFICAYNFVFSFFPLTGDASSGMSMHRCLDELLYVRPTFWFVFFILKCYAVYWVGTRFMNERFRLLFFFVCAIVNLNLTAPCGHLEAEQSFSFLAGVLISRNKQRLLSLSDRAVKWSTFVLLLVGAALLLLKSVPLLHSLKGSIAYNYLLCPFRLSVGLAFIPLFSMMRVEASSLLRRAGKYSLEIYIAHIPFIGLIAGVRGLVVFLVYSAISFALLLAYRSFVEKRAGIAESLYVLVNVLFVTKYSSRISESVVLFASLSAVAIYYVVIRVVLPYIYSELRLPEASWMRRFVCSLSVLAFAGMLVAQYAIDPYELQVDRWSALHFPIQNLLSGIYPYTASTHLGGYASPFPVWQILHVPFYLVGNVGLSFFAATALFLWSCWKRQGREKAAIVCVLLWSSVAVWYEAMVRSDLITNFLLLAAIVNVVFYRMSQQWVEQHRWAISCIVGLLACTRVIVLIPVAILLLPYFIRMNWRRQVATALLTAVVFGLTFVPFAVWDWQEFYYFRHNPWALQTSQGNVSDFILFVPLTVFLAMNYRANVFRYYRNSALMLVVFVCATFCHNMYLYGNWDLFSPTFDITYFSTAIPFCLLAIAENYPKNNK